MLAQQKAGGIFPDLLTVPLEMLILCHPEP